MIASPEAINSACTPMPRRSNTPKPTATPHFMPMDTRAPA
jgi:hypothetical protein